MAELLGSGLRLETRSGWADLTTDALLLAEFCRPDFKIILAKDAIDFEIYTLEEMLPFAFSL